MYEDYDDYDPYLDDLDDDIDMYNDQIEEYDYQLSNLEDDETMLDVKFENDIQEIDDYWDRENEYIKNYQPVNSVAPKYTPPQKPSFLKRTMSAVGIYYLLKKIFLLGIVLFN